MSLESRIPTHPGEILLHEFLRPLGMTQTALARHLDIPVDRVHRLVRGKRGLTPETAWLLSGDFGTTPDFWINLQTRHELALTRPEQPVARVTAA